MMREKSFMTMSTDELTQDNCSTGWKNWRGQTEKKTITLQPGLKTEGLSRESLIKGKIQYTWPPWTNQFKLVIFRTATMLFFFCKMSYLNEEVNCTKPSPSVSVPWLKYLGEIRCQFLLLGDSMGLQYVLQLLLGEKSLNCQWLNNQWSKKKINTDLESLEFYNFLMYVWLNFKTIKIYLI